MTDKGMKKALRIVLQVLINVVIVLFLLQVFMLAYNFAYKVFTDTSVNPTSDKNVTFVIEPDSSTMEIVDGLIDSGLIEDKYVMLAKIYLSSYHGKMMPGTYILSPSMRELTGASQEEETE